jgi:hypothetical protein
VESALAAAYEDQNLESVRWRTHGFIRTQKLRQGGFLQSIGLFTDDPSAVTVAQSSFMLMRRTAGSQPPLILWKEFIMMKPSLYPPTGLAFDPWVSCSKPRRRFSAMPLPGQANDHSVLGRSGTESNITMLARCIAEREVICFEWQSHAWLPMFQFNRSDLSPYPTCRKIIAELSCIYDPWTLALWFSQPNARLSNQAPADALFDDFSTVLQVARADHQVPSL